VKHQKYVDYINNTGQRPLSVEAFDDDNDPIGPMVRRDMAAEGLIYYGDPNSPFPTEPGIYLRPDLIRAQLIRRLK
jgi:hypothetical protein